MIFIGYDHPALGYSGFRKRLQVTIDYFKPKRFILVGDNNCLNTEFYKRKSNSIINILSSWIKGNSHTVGRHNNAQFLEALKSLRNETLFINSAVFNLSQEVIANNKIILDEHDCISLTFKRAFEEAKGLFKCYWYIELHLYKRFERRFISRLKPEDTILLVAFEHRKEYINYDFRGIFDLKPNGYKSEMRDLKTYRLVFVGTKHYRNYDSLNILINQVLRYVSPVTQSKIHLKVVGSFDKNVFDLLTNCPVDYSIHHNVEKVSDYLCTGDIQCAPFKFGGGSKLKVVESVLNGVPVFGTNTTFTGFDFIPDKFVSDDLQELAKKLELALILGKAYYNDEFEQVFKKFENYYWDRIFC